MTFDEWYEKSCIKDSPGKGMYATHEGDWIYKEDCREIWDSIMADAIAPTDELLAQLWDECIPHPITANGISMYHVRAFAESVLALSAPSPEAPAVDALTDDICKVIHDCENSCPDGDYRTAKDYIAAVRAHPASEPKAPYLPCPICNGVEGCDHTVPERRAASAPKALTGERIAEIWEHVSGRPMCEGSIAHSFAHALIEELK